MLLFVRFMFLQLIQIFDQNLIFLAENHVFKHCGDVRDDVILLLQILEVLRNKF